MLIMILCRQIAIMALLMAGGLLLIRRGLLSDSSVRELGVILVRIVIPCVVLKSYMIEFSYETLWRLIASTVLSLAAVFISMLVSHVVFGKRDRLQNFAAVFCNAGFIGIPLVQAMFGESAVLYIATFLAFVNLFQQTYGIFIFTGDRKTVSVRTILKTPIFLSIAFGTVLLLLPISYPVVVTGALGYIAGLNTPLAMILLGSYLYGMNWRDVILAVDVYLSVLIRLLVIPLVTLGAFALIPIGDPIMKASILISSATSVGANIAIFAQQCDMNCQRSVKTVCLSTVFSVISMPIFLLFVQLVLPIDVSGIF